MMNKKEQLKELVGKAVLKGYCCGVNDGYMPVSYTHLTLPTIYSV